MAVGGVERRSKALAINGRVTSDWFMLVRMTIPILLSGRNPTMAAIPSMLRIATHPRVTTRPLSTDAAQAHVNAWLAAEPTWIPAASERTMAIYAALASQHQVTGNRPCSCFR